MLYGIVLCVPVYMILLLVIGDWLMVIVVVWSKLLLKLLVQQLDVFFFVFIFNLSPFFNLCSCCAVNGNHKLYDICCIFGFFVIWVLLALIDNDFCIDFDLFCFFTFIFAVMVCFLLFLFLFVLYAKMYHFCVICHLSFVFVVLRFMFCVY